MKSRSLIAAALASSLALPGLSVPADSAGSDQNAVKLQARAELGQVTEDIDKADIMYSPADNGVGPNFSNIEEYQEEYLAGRQSFQDGRYAEALQHLRKADDIIRSQPDWSESE